MQKAKAKAAPKKAAAAKVPKEPKAKAAPKKLVQTTLKAKPTTKKRPLPESDEENENPSEATSVMDASGFDNTPPVSKKQKTTTKKTATDQYQKLTQLEHIIKRPDTYIGSVERTTEQMWVFNSERSEMEPRKVSFVPGLYKIFDEILVNAADNKQRDPSMKNIKVVVDREKGEISVENDGTGIPVEIHEVRDV